MLFRYVSFFDRCVGRLRTVKCVEERQGLERSTYLLETCLWKKQEEIAKIDLLLNDVREGITCHVTALRVYLPTPYRCCNYFHAGAQAAYP